MLTVASVWRCRFIVDELIRPSSPLSFCLIIMPNRPCPPTPLLFCLFSREERSAPSIVIISRCPLRYWRDGKPGSSRTVEGVRGRLVSRDAHRRRNISDAPRRAKRRDTQDKYKVFRGERDICREFGCPCSLDLDLTGETELWRNPGFNFRGFWDRFLLALCYNVALFRVC